MIREILQISRRWIDSILLSDHEWKKKYCPTLYRYLFEMTPEERTAALANYTEEHARRNYEEMIRRAHDLHAHDDNYIPLFRSLDSCPSCERDLDSEGYCGICGLYWHIGFMPDPQDQPTD